MPIDGLRLLRQAAKQKSRGLNSRPRGEFVYELLREAIQKGQFGRGDRVREEEVAECLGVSRTPVREALQRLQKRGLLGMGGGARGLVIAELDRPQFQELFAMREILEGSAARFAAQHADASQIAFLHRINEEFVRASNDVKKMVSINRQFHDAIYHAAHNRFLLQTLEELHDAMSLVRSTTFVLPDRPPVTDREHRRIVKAIEKRDPDEAEKAAREHIRTAQQARLHMLAEGIAI